MFGVIVESPSGHLVVDSSGSILQQWCDNRLVGRGLVDGSFLARWILAVVDQW